MFTKVSVLVPTRHRIGRLQTLISSFDQTTAGADDAELIFRVDEDDTETQEFLDEAFGMVVGPRLLGYRSMPTFFNELAMAASGDVLMCGNDDMVFETLGWACRILEVANQHPDGLFNIGVRTMNEAHFPFSTVSKKAVEALGFLWDPQIFWGDIYLRDVMAYFGRTILVPDVSIVHDWAGNRPDAVFDAAQDLKLNVGTAEYWEGHHAMVRSAVDKLGSLNLASVGVAK